MSSIRVDLASIAVLAVAVTGSAARAAPPAAGVPPHPSAFCGPGMYEAPLSYGSGQMSCYVCPRHPAASPLASIIDQCGTPPKP